MTCTKERLTRKEAMKRARWWRTVRFARMEHYRCASCSAWHVGNDRRKRAAKGVAR